MAPSSFRVSASDGRPLAVYRWTPPPSQAPVGVVVLVHGMGEHIRRYDHVAEALVLAGFVVYGYDHRGHGQSRRPDELPGHLGPQGWAALIDDIGLVVAEARSHYAHLPLTLVAHSMGSFAVQQFLLTRGGEVEAVALTGTAALDLLEPLLDLSSDIDLSAFNAPFAPARTGFDWLSRDEASVDAYINDPDCGSGIDSQSARDMFVGARQLADPTRLALIPAALPIYVAVGSMDPVNGGLTLLWPLVDRLRAAGVDEVTVRVYDAARHELFNETNRTAILDDLVQWVQQMTANLAATMIDASTAVTTDEGER